MKKQKLRFVKMDCFTQSWNLRSPMIHHLQAGPSGKLVLWFTALGARSRFQTGLKSWRTRSTKGRIDVPAVWQSQILLFSTFPLYSGSWQIGWCHSHEWGWIIFQSIYWSKCLSLLETRAQAHPECLTRLLGILDPVRWTCNYHISLVWFSWHLCCLPLFS